MPTLTAVHAQERDEEGRAAGEQQLSAFVRASTKKEKMGLERLLVIESAVRDVATASASALAELQAKLDKVGLGATSAPPVFVCSWPA